MLLREVRRSDRDLERSFRLVDFAERFLRFRDVIREGSRIRVVDGRTKRRDGWTDGWMDVRAKVRTKRSGLSSCLQPRHSSSVCRPRGGMNAFHYDSYLLPDLSTLSAPLLSSLLSFSHGRRFDRISSRSRRIRRRSGEREREKRYRRPKAQPSLYLSTARFIVGKPADFFSFLLWAATHRPTDRPTDRSPGSSTTIIRRIFRVPDRFETRETRSIE